MSGAFGSFSNGMGSIQKYIRDEFCRYTWSCILLPVSRTAVYVSHISSTYPYTATGRKVAESCHGGMVDFSQPTLGVEWLIQQPVQFQSE